MLFGQPGVELPAPAGAPEVERNEDGVKGDETVAQLDKDVQLVVEDRPDLHRLHHGGELVQDLLGLEEQ